MSERDTTGADLGPGYCLWHGYHGMTACPRCSTGFPSPLPTRKGAADWEADGRYHHDGQETERQAARLVRPRSGTQRAAVLAHLELVGAEGTTDYETWRALGRLCARPHVPGTRREELIRAGWPIRDSGRRRPTDTGTPAIVWVLEP